MQNTTSRMQSFHCYMNALLYDFDCVMCACELHARSTPLKPMWIIPPTKPNQMKQMDGEREQLR